MLGIGRILAVATIVGWAAARCAAGEPTGSADEGATSLEGKYHAAGESWPAGSVEASLEPHASAPPRGLAPWAAGHLASLPPLAVEPWEPGPPLPPRRWGNPLSGTSWRNRPWQVGAFFGGLLGDDLIDGRAEQETGLIGGGRVGYDFTHHWGGEVRFAQSEFDVDVGAGADEQSGDEWLLDVDLLLYPWGDAQWRPFVSLGAGVARLQFHDDAGDSHRETLFQIPLGVGVKYFFHRWLALRAEVTHHFILGDSGVDSRDNLSATAGVEFRFGARPRVYYPW